MTSGGAARPLLDILIRAVLAHDRFSRGLYALGERGAHLRPRETRADLRVRPADRDDDILCLSFFLGCGKRAHVKDIAFFMDERDKRHRRRVFNVEPLRRNVLEWVAHRITGISPPSTGQCSSHVALGGPDCFGYHSDIWPSDARRLLRPLPKLCRPRLDVTRNSMGCVLYIVHIS